MRETAFGFSALLTSDTSSDVMARIALSVRTAGKIPGEVDSLNGLKRILEALNPANQRDEEHSLSDSLLAVSGRGSAISERGETSSIR